MNYALPLLALTSLACGRTATPDTVAHSAASTAETSPNVAPTDAAPVLVPAAIATTSSSPPPPATPFVSSCQGIALQVSLKPGSPGLEVEAALKNDGQAEAPLMLTGDGSSFDKRNASVRFALTPNDVGEVGTCGMMNSLEDTDFVTLKPGERRKLDWIYPPQPGKPGRYALTVTYRNDPKAPPIRGGAPRPPSANQLAMLAKTLPCEVASKPVTFEWDGKRAKASR